MDFEGYQAFELYLFERMIINRKPNGTSGFLLMHINA